MGSGSSLAHSVPVPADLDLQVHAGADPEVVGSGSGGQKRLHVPADGERAHALFQRGQDGLRDDRADTQSKIAAIYAPELSDRPVKELVAEKQSSEVNGRRALNKLSRQNDWDVALSAGAHQQINPLIGNPELTARLA